MRTINMTSIIQRTVFIQRNARAMYAKKCNVRHRF